jgi:hypothetical protein
MTVCGGDLLLGAGDAHAARSVPFRAAARNLVVPQPPMSV